MENEGDASSRLVSLSLSRSLPPSTFASQWPSGHALSSRSPDTDVRSVAAEPHEFQGGSEDDRELHQANSLRLKPRKKCKRFACSTASASLLLFFMDLKIPQRPQRVSLRVSLHESHTSKR